MDNIFLTGMSGGGKSTVGRMLAACLRLTFVDLDAEIEQAEGRLIPDIFAAEGEEYFRERETEVLARVCGRDGQVVAGGGGIVLREENMRLAREYGVVVYLRRSAEAILATTDLSRRPLLAAQPQKVAEILEARTPLYERYADYTVDNEGTIAETVERIREIMANL